MWGTRLTVYFVAALLIFVVCNAPRSKERAVVEQVESVTEVAPAPEPTPPTPATPIVQEPVAEELPGAPPLSSEDDDHIPIGCISLRRRGGSC